MRFPREWNAGWGASDGAWRVGRTDPAEPAGRTRPACFGRGTIRSRCWRSARTIGRPGTRSQPALISSASSPPGSTPSPPFSPGEMCRLARDRLAGFRNVLSNCDGDPPDNEDDPMDDEPAIVIASTCAAHCCNPSGLGQTNSGPMPPTPATASPEPSAAPGPGTGRTAPTPPTRPERRTARRGTAGWWRPRSGPGARNGRR